MTPPEFDQCSTDELAVTIDGLHALMCAAQRQLLAVVAAYDRREAWAEDGATSMGAWLTYRLGVSQRTGSEWARVGTALESLPALAEAFGEGRLSFDQVAPLTRLGDDSLAEEAVGWTAAQCAAVARRARPVKDDVHPRRGLRWRWDLDERMLQLRGKLPEDQGATVVAALEAMADSYKPDPETGTFEPYQARCADALAELASSHLGAQASPDRVTVVIHAEAGAFVGEGVAEIDGGPVISAETLRRQSCDCRAEVVAHDPEGKVVGVGRARRTVPAWLARQVRRRDGGCRFPSCERRRWGQAHHRVHWADGGPTDLDNLLWLCPHHHRFVHERGWRIEGDPDDQVVFVRPNGRTMSTGPPPVV